MWTKLTDREAIAMAMQVRDEIRNSKDLSDLSFEERLRRTDALAQVINIALGTIDNVIAQDILRELQKRYRDLRENSGMDLFYQMRDYINEKYLSKENNNDNT